MSKLTPMAAQYQEIKDKHKDAILFFRLGDFYEMFNEDALTASKELEITLTGRGHEENRMPMCGIPHHAAESYIAKLIGKGYKVAVCEQVEDPKLAQGVVKRDVIKIITPGTVVDPEMLSPKTNNYLMAISVGETGFGLAYIDVSTGDFKSTQLEGEEAKHNLLSELIRIVPQEVLLPLDLEKENEDIKQFIESRQIPFSYYSPDHDFKYAAEKLCSQFKVANLEGFGVGKLALSVEAASAIVDYVKDTQKTTLEHINSIQPYQLGDFMFLDPVTARNLELTSTLREKDVVGSLLWVLDHTKTAMGSRTLRRWLLEPLLDREKIEFRLDAVEELAQTGVVRRDLAAELARVYDIERLIGKVASAVCNARDLIALKESLLVIPKIKEILKESRSSILKSFLQLDSLAPIVLLIEKAIIPEPKLALKEGGIIQRGYNAELDEIRSLATGGKEWIAALENSERQRSGIKSLKVGYTRVFGYYLEVTNAHKDAVPPDYIRKQTLVNAERFITPELKEKESMILGAEERLVELEYIIFGQIRRQISEYTKELQNTARALSILDVLLSLAEVAVSNHYVRPKILDDGMINIKEGRHPVIEKTLGQYRFVPNDAYLDMADERFLLITGPNMGGKSTFMRQAALIVLMAQIGSFVPAQSAEIGLVDRIFTRVGASDDIFSGQSTFMVEMSETANILNNATEHSLVILDEIGRGTSTFDGMSIAAAVSEFIHTKIGCKTMFATHYHEITQLADKHPGMRNLNVAVKEKAGNVTFLYKIVPGAADQSYGISVAKLAGLPQEVIQRAQEVYATLEMVENNIGETKMPALPAGRRKKTSSPALRTSRKTSPSQNQIGLF